MTASLRWGAAICIVLQIIGCSPEASRNESAGRQEAVVRPLPDEDEREFPVVSIQLPPQNQGSEPVFLTVADSDVLRRSLAGKYLKRRQGQPTPIAGEQFKVDGSWSASVEAIAMTVLSGTWKVVELQHAKPKICVTVLTRNGSPLADTKEACRDVILSENERIVKLSDLYNRGVISAYDVTPLDEM
jgi:hypothetical protein